MKLNIEYKNIDSVIPYINNTRTHTKEQIEQIKASIKEFGMCTPIGIHNDTIIYGHARIQAMKELGYKEVPTVDLSHLTEAQKKAYTIADNKLALNAGFNEELLKVEIEALQDMNFDIDLLGFDVDELEDLDIGLDDNLDLDESKADEVPEVEENPIIKLGDLIELGHNYQHRVLCGDSTSEDDVRKLFNGDKADITFTSPPYNVGITPHERGKYRNDNDNKPLDEYTSFLNKFTKLSLEVSDFVFSNIQSLSGNKIALITHLYEMRNKYADMMIWDKCKPMQNPAMARRVLNSSFENIYIFSNDATRAIGKKDFRGTIPNIFQLKPNSKREFSDIHKATFDVKLPKLFIDWFVESSVYEPFCGTGTTVIACENAGKKCYGMELDEKYAQVIVQRYVDYTSNPTIKINGKEVDWNKYKDSMGR